MAALEAAVGASSSSESPAASQIASSGFDLLETFERSAPAGGAAIVGSASQGEGTVRWQYTLSAPTLRDTDWSQWAGTIAALGSPVRLHLLQLIDSGVDSSSELAARDDLGTTGQVQHHLRALVAAGWLESFARGRYRIPAPRLVPLLAVLVAAHR